MNSEKISNKDILKFSLPFFIGFIILWALFSDVIFFWDTVSQASKRGSFYYNTNFSQLLLAPELDSGHPPFFNIYIALGWKNFGRTLFTSHLLMLPFLLGIIFQLARLVTGLFPKKWWTLAMIMAIIDTTFLAQSVLVSPDIVMLFGFLLCLAAIYENRTKQLVVGTFFMPFVSIRGILLTIVIGLIYLIHNYLKENPNLTFKLPSLKVIIKSILPFLPVGICLILYLTYHYSQTGWWISSPNPNWIVHREVNDFQNMFRNIGLIGWRFLDNGRIICSLFLVYFFFKLFKKDHLLNENSKFLLNAFLSFLIIFSPIFIFYSVAINNRYLLPAFILLHLLISIFIISSQWKEKTKKGVLGIIIVLLISGTFWVYPRHIAQGWDGTLAHLPYYSLRIEMIEYIESQQIPLETIGTEFPNKGPFDRYDLNGRQDGFVEKDFSQNQYIFYSNVMNDFTDEELNSLDYDWEIIKEIKKGQICVVLYKKK